MTDRRIGVIGTPGKWSTEILADALEQRTGFRLVIDMADVTADLVSGKLASHDVNLCDLDGLIVKKISKNYAPNTLDRLDLLKLAEAAGVRVFSPSTSIQRLVNRLTCTMTLQHDGIPMPATRITEDPDAAMEAVMAFGKAIFKPLYSSKAQGMILMDAMTPEAETRANIIAFGRSNPMMYIQQKVDLPGHDLGMVFLGGEYIGSYARVAQGDAWNTTIDSGGKYAPAHPPTDAISIARRAQSLFNMDYTTVDVALTKNGPIVFEVSAFGGFRGASEGIGIDAAALYAEYALSSLS